MADTNSSLEQRLIRLEETSYFQDTRLGEVDSELHSLRNEVKDLTRQVENLRQVATQLRELAEGIHRGTAHTDPPPPHYSAHNW